MTNRKQLMLGITQVTCTVHVGAYQHCLVYGCLVLAYIYCML